MIIVATTSLACDGLVKERCSTNQRRCFNLSLHFWMSKGIGMDRKAPHDEDFEPKRMPQTSKNERGHP